MLNIFKIIGIIGLIFICIGMLVKNRGTRDKFSFVGGVGLLTYSIYLGDTIFILLQVMYTLIIVFDFIRQKIKHA